MDENKQITIGDLEKKAPLREVFADTQKSDDIDLTAFHLDNSSADKPESRVDFSGTTSVNFKEDAQLHYWRQFLRLVTLTWIGLIGGILSFAVYYYNNQLAQPIIAPTIKPYISMVHDTYRSIIQYLGGTTYTQLNALSLIGQDAQTNLKTIVSSSLSFIEKKYILQNKLDLITQQYQEKTQEVENTQRDIAQYGYLPQDVVNIFQQNNTQVSLQRGLVALEAIKFTTAIKVFSYLDTFVTGLSDYLSLDPVYVKDQMQRISNRGEQDIYAFLSNCYMNPYELSYDCGVVGDFDVRYASQKNSNVDPVFFKQLLYYIDQKLEQTEVPSLSIVFQKFDPRAQTISFSIEVNTFQQDEATLVQAGIINPHIFIVTNVIHLLQQSRFIQGSSIDAKQINIQPKVVRIGSSQFVVNNSLLQYTLPIQKDVAREIDDFTTQ